MKKIKGYIIERYNNMSNAYTSSRLIMEGKKRGIEISLLGVSDTIISDEKLLNNGNIIEARDFVINRYKYGFVKDKINDLCIASYNEINSFNLYVNKYNQIKNLKSNYFEMPQSILGNSSFDYDVLKSMLGSPFIMKGLDSSQGNEVFLINNKTDFVRIGKKFVDRKEWLFQEFINTSIGRDIRFFCLRGEVIACMTRISTNQDFRANYALGARVENLEIDDSFRKIAKDIYKTTNLDFIGIDLLFGVGKPYFCEINVMPGIEGIEMAAKTNVAERIIETIEGDL